MRFIFAGVAAAILASPLLSGSAASASPAEGQSKLEEEGAERFRKFYDDLFSQRYAEALRAAGQFKVEASNREGRAIVAAMKAAALLGLKREKEAHAQLAELKALAPAEPFSAVVLFHTGLLVERFDVAADAMDTLIDRFPDVARKQDPEAVGMFLRGEPKGQETRNEDRRIALARIGFGGDTSVADWYAVPAVNILMRRGDVSGAAELIRYIDEPQAVEDMLITRRFESLWPKLEQHAGRQLEDVRASSLATAQRAYEAQPDDHEKLAQFANALRHAGHLDEAIALRGKLPATAQAMSAADEQMGWAINIVALALHEAGRADEADTLFAMLNDAPMPQEYWRVNMKINRLELLVADGRYEKALPLVEPTARTEGSPYAEQLVRRLRYCVLSGLGRKEEAAGFRAEMLKHADDAPHATIDGLLCAGEIEEAERVSLAALRMTGVKKDSFAGDFVRQLQPVALTSDDPSVWQGRWQELRARPAIKREFDRIGRDMPAEFLVPKGQRAPAN